jgi:hypothetical protein
MHFDRVLLMLDGDDTGRRGTVAIANTLTPHLPVSVITLDDHVQPDELGQAEFQRLMSRRDIEGQRRLNGYCDNVISEDRAVRSRISQQHRL